MTKYTTEIVHVTVGLLGGFDTRLKTALQPVLDKGSKEGKKLHSIQYIQARSNIHLTYLVVWESSTATTKSKATKSSSTTKSKAK